MVKGEKRMTAKERDALLIENFIGLQKAMTHMAIKFDSLSENISKLITIFELSARDYLANKGVQTPEVDHDLLKKIDALLDQNKTIAKGLLMVEEKVRSKTQPLPTQQMSTQAPPQSFVQSQPMAPTISGEMRPIKPKPFSSEI